MKFIIHLLLMLFLCSTVQAEDQEWILVHNGETQKVLYDLYIPPSQEHLPLTVLVCVGGLPIEDGRYTYSSTQECMNNSWRSFADHHGVLILGLGFLFIEDDWETKQSYQYAQAWSGNALIEILNELSIHAPLNGEVMMFGISAGAQFGVRFAQLNPNTVKAVAAHAAGGYDRPQSYMPTRFLLTVGEEDNKEISRVAFAQQFVREAKKYNIDAQLKVIPGIGHVQTEPQNQLSRAFFAETLSQY